MAEQAPVYLFSVDLEDIRAMVDNGESFPERVTPMTGRYLDFLRRHQSRATFFTAGDVLRKFPELIETILADGHELACHTDRHRPLPELGRDGFCRDLEAWTRTVEELGWPKAEGFRAPTFSLISATDWAYQCLEDFGFSYSSSVLPAPHPLYGWPGHGEAPRRHGRILELPMGLARIGPWRVPLGGGVYFRAIPRWYLRHWFRRQKAEAGKRGVLGYFHPYDIDPEPPPFAYPGLPPAPWWQWIMRRGRHGVPERLEWILAEGFRILPYQAYVDELENESMPS